MQRRPGSFYEDEFKYDEDKELEYILSNDEEDDEEDDEEESVRPENPMGKTLNDERDVDKSDVAVANSVPISMKIPPTLTEGEKRMLRNLYLRKISPKKQAQLLA